MYGDEFMFKRKSLFFIIVASLILLTGCFQSIDPAVVEIFNERYSQDQRTLDEFSSEFSRYRARLTLGSTTITLVLSHDETSWSGRLSLGDWNDASIFEEFQVKLLDDYLVVDSDPQREIPITELFFNRFDPSLFLIESAGEDPLGSPRFIGRAYGNYDVDSAREFMESFYHNFVSLFSSFEHSERYFYNLDMLFSASFSEIHTMAFGFNFHLFFNEESEQTAWNIRGNAEMAFAEGVY